MDEAEKEARRKVGRKNAKWRSAFRRASPVLAPLGAASDTVVRLAYLAKVADWITTHGDLDIGGDYQTRTELFRQVMESEALDGPIDYLEFGTFSGISLRWWLEHNPDAGSRFHSFDTFEGLPEAWDGVEAGTFDREGATPDVRGDQRVTFHRGVFQDTLPRFLEEGPAFGRRTVVHLDADLYTSTLYVLARIGNRLRPGDVVFMADFCSLRHPSHAFRAFEDFVAAFRLDYELLRSSNAGHQAAIRIVAPSA